MNRSLEQRLKELEKRVATLEGQVQEQLSQSLNVNSVADKIYSAISKTLSKTE